MASILNATTTNGLVTSADNSGSLQLQTNNGTTAVTIDTSQNVGIGTSSPNSAGVSLACTLNASNATTGGIYELNASGTRYGYLFSNASNTVLSSVQALPLLFNTTNTERMRITSGGELLVGTTAANGRVTADSTAGGTNQAFWGKNSGGSGAATIVAWNATTTGNPIFVDFYTEAGATQRGTITYNRATGQVAYNVTSDERLKENIVDAPSALNKINSIKIRSFDWKETGNHNDFGVIAQELNQVAPEAVTEGTDNNDGTIKHAWGVDTAALVPAMIKAIQEQQAQIEELKAEVKALKGVA